MLTNHAMAKRINIFLLMILIVGQTILTPLASANVGFAEGDEGESGEPANEETKEVETASVTDGEEQEVNKDKLDKVIKDFNEDEKDNYTADSFNAYEVAVNAGKEVAKKAEATQVEVDDAVKAIEKAIKALQKTSTEPNSDEGDEVDNNTVETDGSQKGASTEGNSADELDGGISLMAETPKEINASMTKFEMKVNNQVVTNGSNFDDIDQDATANFEVEFSVPLEDGENGPAWPQGSYFEFPLPKSLINFEGNFQGANTVDGITYTYATDSDNKVTVTLTGDGLELPSNEPGILNIKFSSGFNNLGNGIEQELEIPAGNGGTDTIKATFTFKPSTSNEKVSKKAIGNPEIINGNHQMEWEVWVNKAGKVLSNVALTDDPTGGHKIVDGTVNVYSYDVNLDGVVNETGQGTPVLTNGVWDNVNDKLTGRNAYKITYKTEVTLSDEERDGPKTFNNKVTLINEGQGQETSNNPGQTITYGKALEKHNATGGNYTKKWRIDYNHNLLSIPQNQASLTDTISGPHDIDFSTIKVYKMNEADGSIKSTVPTTGHLTTGFTISPNTGTGKTFTITFDDTITDAYTVTYDSVYTGKDFLEQNDITGELKNTVTNGANVSKTGTYSLSENLLTKSRTVNFDSKEITWTVKITSDNPDKAITGLTLTDTFKHGDYNGEHTLVNNSVKIDGQDAIYTLIDNDPTKGFTIENINVAAGQTATVTYKTKFAIGDKGTVEEQGYGNTAKTEWTDENNVTYNKTKTAYYKPETTTVNNGKKDGKFNYETREFTWDVRVNINMKDIAGAILVDTIGDGHKFVEDSIEVLPLTNLGGSDTGGMIGTTPIDASNYSVTEITNKGFTLTFNDSIDQDLNNKAYVIRYKTIDEDDIIGIESTNENANPAYVNNATFTTKGDQTFSLEEAKVTLNNKVANNLIDKSIVSQNQANNGKVIWKLDVNRSHSNLGKSVQLTDLPGDNQWLLEDSIEIATYNVSSTGISDNSDWTKVSDKDGVSVEFDTNGGFTLTFDSLENVGYQVRYETIGFGKSGDALENTATLHYGGQTANNQNTEEKFNGNMTFSSSDSSFTSTRGSAKFKKVGIDTTTNEVKDEALEGVEFRLEKRAGSNTYVIKTATTDANGEFTFENVPYNDYHIVEVVAPNGYDKMDDFEFTLDSSTTLDQNPNLVTTLYNYTPFDSNACTVFEITIKDVDGDPIISGEVTLTDSNGNKTTHSNWVDGKLQLPDKFTAGKYKVTHDNEGDLGEVTVKYDGTCEDEVQPAPTCDKFTITLKVDNEPREGEELTIKKGNEEVAKETTGTDGSFTIPSSDLPAGTYDVYKGEKKIGEVEVSYKDECKAEVTLSTPENICPYDTITVNKSNGQPDANVEVTIVGEDGNEIYKVTTDQNGKVQTDQPLESSKTYKVIKGTKVLGEFTKDLLDCEYKVQPKPSGGGGWVPPAPTCDDFTITVKEDGAPVGADLELTLKSGTTEIDVTTDSSGKVVIDKADLPEGSYTVYDKDGNEVGSITVTYEEGKCQDEINLTKAPVCDDFTVTIKEDGKPVNSGDYTFTSEDGSIVKTETVDSNGKIVFDRDELPEGKYTVEDEEGRTSSITVEYTKDSCGADVNFTTEEDPEDPEEPVEPGEEDPKDPTDPEDPNKPGTGDPTDPNEEDDGSTKGDGSSKDPSDKDDGSTKGDGASKDPSDKGDGSIKGDGASKGSSDKTGVKGSAAEGVDGSGDGTLPKTATNVFNIALIGLVLLTVGFVLNRRRATE